MKTQLAHLIEAALSQLKSKQLIPDTVIPVFHLERTRQKSHGDFACNVAMTLAKELKQPPRTVAELVVKHLPADPQVIKVEIAGPGFLNFFLASGLQQQVIADILKAKSRYGLSHMGQGRKVHVEFVSANPTGPLHVGHGRGAAFGSALSSVLKAAGFAVHREYYVNDAGRQMDILATSIWLRYLERQGAKFEFPSNGYKGTYVFDIVDQLIKEHGHRFVRPIGPVFEEVFPDAPAGDKERHIDDLIAHAKRDLGDDFEIVHAFGLKAVLDDIKDDLAEFKVEYDEYFSENSLMKSGAVEAAVKRLTAQGLVYEKEGAQWFKSTQFGDDKDRVIVRENGMTTYFASDAAYLLNKFDRGFDEVVYVLGADHHGYVPRLKALMQAYGFDLSRLKTPLVQFAVLYRGDKQVQMSTRSGEFVTLRDLRDEVGTDATRFFYLMRKSDQHLDFDLDLAKSESNDNPVYYIQYAHARISSVFRQLAEKGWTFEPEVGLQHLDLLAGEHEDAVIDLLVKFPELIELAAQKYEPHLLCYYLKDLAHAFHSYYNYRPFLVEDAIERNTRLVLVSAVLQVLRNGLNILDLSAPEKM